MYCDDAHWEVVNLAVQRHVQSHMLNRWGLRQVMLPFVLKHVNRLTFHKGDTLLNELLPLYLEGSVLSAAAPSSAAAAAAGHSHHQRSSSEGGGGPPTIVSSHLDVQPRSTELQPFMGPSASGPDTTLPPSACAVWVSGDALRCAELVVLVPTAGAARPGVWSRRATCTGGLSAGSQLPYIEAAAKQKWGVLITNPNQTHATLTPAEYKELAEAEPGAAATAASASGAGAGVGAVAASSSAKCGGNKSKARDEQLTRAAHLLYVWDHLISGTHSAAQSIAIVAHGAGGRAVMALLRYRCKRAGRPGTRKRLMNPICCAGGWFGSSRSRKASQSHRLYRQ